MSKKYEIFLFDLDGTITDSALGITNSVMYALKKFDIEETDRTKLYKFIGPPLTESFEKFYGFTKEQSLDGVKYYREYYAVKGIFENSVYEGLAETLESLKNEGYILAVATSKPEEYAKRIADKFDFAKYFAGIYGATMDGSLIRKADVIRYALDNLGVERENYDQVVMVGDRNNDIYGAKENGIRVIGVLYGYGDLAELQSAGADYIAKMPEEIAQIIGRCNHERV